jgi:polar amino acid transport system substrate-binding protein
MAPFALANQVTPAVTLYTNVQPPYVDVINGQASGMMIDLIEQLFTRAEVEYSIEFVPWRRAFLTAQTEQNSCVFPVQRSQEREPLLHWIGPIQITKTGFYTLEKDNFSIRTIADVEGYTIGSLAGGVAAEYLAAQGIHTSETSENFPNLLMLGSHRIDIWASDTVTADYIIHTQGGDKKIRKSLEFFTTLRALGCHLDVDQSTIDQLSRSLKSMYQDGTIDKILMRY